MASDCGRSKNSGGLSKQHRRDVANTGSQRLAADGGACQRAVRSGEWQLLVDSDHLLLFNVQRDIGEREDRAKERPDLVAKLSNMLSEWEKDVNAEAQVFGRGR